ncbi:MULTISPECIES: GNAT family N-acetyltransferase [Psychrobacter]|uniref:Acetyltransferase GCN5 n=1 Tax=Psychrobacter alimentarius TaxID=261164 RepID=A0ABM6A0F5_9GAMM|nr:MULTISPECIES: GNAT family N-acetyltransferase [Psychrobacter]AMT97716.1 acetyltransferase GCN5 [Psychrobacter alimentarius]
MKIEIRHAEPEDADALQAIHADEALYANTLQLPMPSKTLWRKRLADIPENMYMLVAEIEDEVVGSLGLQTMTSKRQRHVASFGVSVKTAAQGKGVGRALINAALDLADNWLDIRRIEITTYTDNTGAIGLYESLGFVIEGEMVDYAYRNGEYVNAYQMARIRKVKNG